MQMSVQVPAPAGERWTFTLATPDPPLTPTPKPAPPAPAKRRGARGEVYLVGAGPGDPDLLTVRAVKLMKRADVALYDSLISPGVLALLPARTERIYVGKQRANHTMRQEAINDLLVEHERLGVGARLCLHSESRDGVPEEGNAAMSRIALVTPNTGVMRRSWCSRTSATCA